MAEQTHVHRPAAVEHVFKRNIVNEVLREVLIGIGVRRIVSAHHYLESVVEKGLRHAVAVACGGRF